MSPGPAAAALGEEDGRQAHPLDELEQAVLLAVAERALGAGEHRVVVGEDRAGGCPSNSVAVAADHPVGRRALDEVLRSRRARCAAIASAAVLDEAARVDEVRDVLARGAAAALVAALDRVRPRLVAGERAALQRLVAHSR